MATKKTRRKSAKSSGRRAARSTNQRLEQFAEDLGRMLGSAQARASAWLNQRKDLAQQFAEIRDSATSMLQQLSKENPFGWGRGTRARPRRRAAAKRRKGAASRRG